MTPAMRKLFDVAVIATDAWARSGHDFAEDPFPSAWKAMAVAIANPEDETLALAAVAELAKLMPPPTNGS